MPAKKSYIDGIEILGYQLEQTYERMICGADGEFEYYDDISNSYIIYGIDTASRKYIKIRLSTSSFEGYGGFDVQRLAHMTKEEINETDVPTNIVPPKSYTLVPENGEEIDGDIVFSCGGNNIFSFSQYGYGTRDYPDGYYRLETDMFDDIASHQDAIIILHDQEYDNDDNYFDDGII